VHARQGVPPQRVRERAHLYLDALDAGDTIRHPLPEPALGEPPDGALDGLRDGARPRDGAGRARALRGEEGLELLPLAGEIHRRVPGEALEVVELARHARLLWGRQRDVERAVRAAAEPVIVSQVALERPEERRHRFEAEEPDVALAAPRGRDREGADV